MTERNVAAITELADFLETAKFHFDMNQSEASPACGSAGCIGGHAAVLWPEVRMSCFEIDDERFSWEEKLLAQKLGIENIKGIELCFLNSFVHRETDMTDLNRITRKGAVTTLRRLAETGEVIWKAEEQIPE